MEDKNVKIIKIGYMVKVPYCGFIPTMVWIQNYSNDQEEHSSQY
jgi:hypothetical protein